MKFLLKALFVLISLASYAAAAGEVDMSAFNVSAALSASSIPIDDTVTLNMSLSYPEGFQPDIDQMIERLLTYNGQGEPPFNLDVVEKGKPEIIDGKIKQSLTFIFQPQIVGKYSLSPKVIRFSKKGEKDNGVTIPTQFFEINVTDIPKSSPTEAMIAPFLALDSRLPLTLSYENKISLIGDQNNSKKENGIAEAIASRSFPWAPLIAVCSAALIAMLIWAIPYANRREKEESDDIEQRKQKVKNILRSLSEYVPATTEETNIYFTKIENSLKQLLETNYSIKASTKTTEELFSDINALKNIPPIMKKQLIEIFETDDKIKFGKYPPASKDAASAAETARNAAELL